MKTLADLERLLDGREVRVWFEGGAWRCREEEDGVGGSGPTVEAAIRDALARAAEAFEDELLGDEACPGCGCVPGDGATATCSHPLGCGWYRAAGSQDPADGK